MVLGTAYTGRSMVRVAPRDVRRMLHDRRRRAAEERTAPLRHQLPPGLKVCA